MDKIRSTQLILGLALAVAAIGCDQPGSGQLGQSGDVAEVTASLTTVPSGVLCVKLALSGSVSSSLMLTVASGASSASMSLGYVPAGNLTVTPSAFNVACSWVTSSTVPTWTGPAATVTVVARTPLVVPLTLQPYSATATVNFVPFVKAVGASWSSNYALLSDGTVRAWGYNVDGELGDGTTTQRLTPVVVSGLSGVASMPQAGWATIHAHSGPMARSGVGAPTTLASSATAGRPTPACPSRWQAAISPSRFRWAMVTRVVSRRPAATSRAGATIQTGSSAMARPSRHLPRLHLWHSMSMEAPMRSRAATTLPACAEEAGGGRVHRLQQLGRARNWQYDQCDAMDVKFTGEPRPRSRQDSLSADRAHVLRLCWLDGSVRCTG